MPLKQNRLMSKLLKLPLNQKDGKFTSQEKEINLLPLNLVEYVELLTTCLRIAQKIVVANTITKDISLPFVLNNSLKKTPAKLVINQTIPTVTALKIYAEDVLN